MFSMSNKVKAVCVAAVMMMMMMMMPMTTEAAAMPKHAHRKSSDGAAAETVPLQLDPKALVPIGNIRPLQNASISPWTYNITHDDSLFPAVLSEARCLRRGCLDSEGREDLKLESRPIMHQVLLLRRVKSTGAGSEAGARHHYRLESRLIAVGCTCVRPTVLHQD